ncbi:acyl-CoA N-acyltransferase [Polyplosphaeria fusca]|uniref:Acyl-CoA N-acyltransferase n=1 Tax=Polyplosphaeria fusca TaxID=682080 RepID=A0A9P4UYI6_9PLEO|nr:acyl-CoA N-acyltransferase [Polyplosphaeria fusca]
MALTLEEVKADGDFDEIVSVLYAAFGHPHKSLRQRPTVEELEADPDLYWIKVTDTKTGRMAGAAEWEVRKTIEKPSGEPKPLNAYWHTEGSGEKQFAEQMLTQFKTFMKARMGRPHLELEQIVVHPDHRERGAGKLLMDWGIAKADKLGLESCVQSVPFAVPLYEKYGYANLDTLDPDMSISNPSKEWADDDLRTHLMWRPAGRHYQEGTDKRPWLAS